MSWPDYPKFDDVRLNSDLCAFSMRMLDPFDHGCLLRIVGHLASQMVYTYTEPSDDPKVRYDAEEVRRICGMIPLAQATSLLSSLSCFFTERDGWWRLNDPSWIEIAPRRGGRPSLPPDLRRLIRNRDGDVCAYCGSIDGPFEADHVFPVVRGGSDDPGNLTIACENCNRSKGGKTLRDWMASR